MSPRPSTGKTKSLHIAATPELLKAIDDEAARLTRETRIPITRSDVARRWLEDGAERAKKK